MAMTACQGPALGERRGAGMWDWEYALSAADGAFD